jgi:tetratricopeptide (TPR) repeat protein
MGYKKSVFLLFFCTAILLSCSKKGQSSKSVSGTEPAVPVNQRAFEDAFYEGNKQMVLGNHQEAIKKFKDCVTLDPKNATVYYLMAKEYNALRQFDNSLVQVKSAIKIDENQVWYQLLLADDLVHLNRNLEAAKCNEMIADKFSDNEALYFDAAEQYMVSNKPSDALRCLDKLEKKKGVSEEVSFKKEEIFIRQNNKNDAIAELQKLINVYPNTPRYQVALAEVYYTFKEDAKAMEILDAALRLDPALPEAHMLLANIYRNKGENDKSYKELKIVFANPEADIRQKIQVLSTYLPLMSGSEIMRSEAMELGNLLIIAHPEEPAANMIYGDILFSSEKFDDAKKHYLKALSTNKNSSTLWENLIQCEDHLAQYDSGRVYADEAIEAFPSKSVFYFYKAYFSFRLKDYQSAADVSKLGYELGSENARINIQLLIISGDALNALKRYAESDAAYDKVLEMDPGNLQVLNNYAYYLSLRKEKLEKAETMSKKTLELDPGNATFLDTYGWVLYCQGNYADAKIYIEKALEKMPDNPTLNEHLGDIYYRLNNIGKAVDYWKRSKDEGNTSDAITQKINTKKIEDQ